MNKTRRLLLFCLMLFIIPAFFVFAGGPGEKKTTTITLMRDA